MSATVAMHQGRFNRSIDEADDEDCASFLMTLKYRVLSNNDLYLDNNTFTPSGDESSSSWDDMQSVEARPVTPSPVANRPPLTESSDCISKMSCLKMTESPEKVCSQWTDEHSDHYTEGDYDHFSSLAGLNAPLSLPDDKYWLSDVQCYIREHCTEVFSATEFDVRSPKKSGRSRPIEIGQVGIRCVFCRDVPYSRRASQAVSFPSQIAGMYSAIVMMQCRHFAACAKIPEEVREKIAALKQGRSPNSLSPTSPHVYGGGSSGRQQYWVESAKKMGLVDTPRGIRFQQDPRQQGAECRNEVSTCNDEVVPRRKASLSTVEEDLSSEQCAASYTSSLSSSPPSPSPICPEEDIPSLLVVPEDKQLVPDYLYLAMAQMMPCQLTELDRVGCYKGREVGFPGMACKHCGGLPGFGKYFPATVRSLAQTTTSQTILKHVGSKCKRCPPHIRTTLLQMQERANRADRNSKPKYGSRKVFFQRLWGRLHQEHVPQIEHLRDEPVETMDDDVSSIADSTNSESSADECDVDDSTKSEIVSYDERSDDRDSYSSISSHDNSGCRKRKAERQLSKYDY